MHLISLSLSLLLPTYLQSLALSHQLPSVFSCKATELKEDRSPSNATVTTTFTILLIDKNDNAPKFNSSEYRVRITELAQVGFALPLFIQAEDKDEVSPNHSHNIYQCRINKCIKNSTLYSLPSAVLFTSACSCCSSVFIYNKPVLCNISLAWNRQTSSPTNIS